MTNQRYGVRVNGKIVRKYKRWSAALKRYESYDSETHVVEIVELRTGRVCVCGWRNPIDEGPYANDADREHRSTDGPEPRWV